MCAQASVQGCGVVPWRTPACLPPRTSRRASRQPRTLCPPPAAPSLQGCVQGFSVVCCVHASHSDADLTESQTTYTAAQDGWDALAALAEPESPEQLELATAQPRTEPARAQPQTAPLLQPFGAGMTAPAAATRPASLAHPQLLFPAPAVRPQAIPPPLPTSVSTTGAIPPPYTQAPQPPRGAQTLVPAPQLSAPGAPPQQPRKARTPRTNFAHSDPAAQRYTALPVSVSTLTQGTDIARPPKPLKSFNDLKRTPYAYNRHLLARMLKLRYNTPLPVQRHVIPAVTAGKCKRGCDE